MGNDAWKLEIEAVPGPSYAPTNELPVAQAKEALEGLGKALAESVPPLLQQLSRAKAADEIELELGVSLKAEKKWVVVSAEAGATITLRLLWKNP